MKKTQTLYRLLKVVSSHPDWDEDLCDSEYEIAIYSNKEEAEKKKDKLGRSYGDATHRAYYHKVQPVVVIDS